ncbi:MAG: MurT ligase domain-containing protein [Solirubrobacterales bacterium]
MRRLRAALAALVARACAVVLRAAGRGATSLPGRVLLAIDPDAIAERAARLPGGSVVVSATNGKTTTCSMLASILEEDGDRPVHNRAGANMAGGIASTLLEQHGDIGLFEVDEFWLDGLVGQLKPRAVVLGNLFRDQLDRYGELDTIVSRWSVVAAGADAGRLVLSADDPSIAGLGDGVDGALYFGIEDASVGTHSSQHASEQVRCPRCASSLAYSVWYVGHLGDYRCRRCDWARPQPAVTASAIELLGLGGSRFTLGLDGRQLDVQIPLPGLYNVYNATAAAAGALAIGVDPETIAGGLRGLVPVFGRAETVEVAGRPCSILLVKNPAGANEVMRTVALEEGRHDVLFVLNDLIADGRDVSWIWDADFEALVPRVASAVCSGTRAVEMALRLKYAGVPDESLSVVAELPAALAAAAGGEGDRLLAFPTYTAMLDLREHLVDEGAARESFA